MKSNYTFLIYSIVLLLSIKQYGQHHSTMNVTVNMDTKSLTIDQEITYYNQSGDTLRSIVLNDWNNAFAYKNSPLGKRFSDEFYKAFHMAKDKDRGKTLGLIVEDQNRNTLSWERTLKNPDYITVKLPETVAPGQKITLHLSYISKIPNEKFSKYGFSEYVNSINLKYWFITPARYEMHQFITYSNENLDDAANAISDFDISLKVANPFTITTDLLVSNNVTAENKTVYTLNGKNRREFDLIIEEKSTYKNYKVGDLEVATNLDSSKLNDSITEKLIKQIVDFTSHKIGNYPFDKIVISQADYEKNPFYGSNQLPKFIRPFPEDFIFEIKFLKTYLNSFLKNSLQLDSRKDNWIYDGIQVFSMINYIDEFHPDSKMTGSASKYLLFRGFKLAKVDFNEQYSYYYMLMARKNLDQPLNSPKNTLIKFNVQIANKYRAGLTFKYLDDYLGATKLTNGIREFYSLNKVKQTTRSDFENAIKANADKNIDWFFKYLIDSREIIDYKFNSVSRTKDSVTFIVKNKSVPVVPVPVFGINKKQIVFKKWIEPEQIDSTLTFDRKNATKIVLNHDNEVPEYNLRDNSKSLTSFSLNRPLKFTFFEDLEDAHYSQLFYVPTLFYNLYDGITPGLNIYNYSFFEKTITFSLNPMYSINTKSVVGSYNLGYNQNLRNGRLYAIRYSLNGSYYHYAPDAGYLKLYPSLSMYFREPSYRDNRKQALSIKYNIINKEPSAIVIDSTDNYSILSMKYYNTKTEVTNHIKFLTDLQLSSYFGKFSAEIEYRKLFENNRFFNIRGYAGTFLYNTNDTQNYNFGLSRANDYLFDNNAYARSDTTGILSQQYFMSQGGFKSFLNPSTANQWIATTNMSYTIWNWIDVYGDFGFVANKGQHCAFLYDSGIRLNLVTDYFELFFPVYSTNGLEINQKQYNEKIRFIFTFSPKSLINLFTRKWF